MHGKTRVHRIHGQFLGLSSKQGCDCPANKTVNSGNSKLRLEIEVKEEMSIYFYASPVITYLTRKHFVIGFLKQ